MQNGDPAPAFALPRIEAHGALGDKQTLPPGKPVVLDFWATWCKPCLQAMPALDALAKRHPELTVIAVNLDDPVAARELFDARHYAMLLVADDGDTSNRYGVSTIPHTVLVDRTGLVRVVSRGDDDTIERAVEEIRK